MPTAELGPTGRSLAENIKAARGRMPLRELSDRLKNIGRPILPSGLMKIERAERRVDVDDLVALARALEIPPVMLLLPLGKAATVEVSPGYAVPTWDAVKWFTGHGWPVPEYFREHDELVETVQRNAAQGQRDLAANFARHLAALRKNMRRADVLPPELPAELADMPELQEGER